VTFLPLACSGATIDSGLIGAQRGRECIASRSGLDCQGTVNAQVSELGQALTAAKRRQPQRRLDMILLTVGANDIGFSGLVADVIVDAGKERTLFRRTGVLGAVADSRAALERQMPRGFAAMRQALRPLVDGDLSRVVFVSYADPVRQDDQPCGNGRDGFDIHPSFNADPARMAQAETFVHDEFLPALKALALCDGDAPCSGGASDRMTFVDQHQQPFTQHSVCAHAPSDPEFDRECFSVAGNSFNADPVAGATAPMACGRSAGDFRAYLPRQRWIRTANDSYFAAMTYPQGLGAALQPADIHDASWGVLSAVYGGAVHPTAEGYAAMADAAIPAVVNALCIEGAAPQLYTDIVGQPLPPPGTTASGVREN
jgi:lysophospholipase L1-like esterase